MDADLTWFPLVLRSRPPGLPLDARIAELARLAEPATGTPRLGQITRACEVLNKAALICSDCGRPDLARSLCRQQYEMFDQAKPWPSWAIKLAMQPLLNIARQLIREGHADRALALLESLYAAARCRASVIADGCLVDFDTLTATTEDHKAVCISIWTALLADGTRALALAGRWKEAAEQAAAHRGIGTRLLDGRQVSIIASLAEGNPVHAFELVEQSKITEPWEHTVQGILRILCGAAAGDVTAADTRTMLASALALAQTADVTTTAARTRIGVVALDTAGDGNTAHAEDLHAAITELAMQDAYAAHDVLTRQAVAHRLTVRQSDALHDLVRASGLGTETVPRRIYEQLMAAVARSAATLGKELAQAVVTANARALPRTSRQAERPAPLFGGAPRRDRPGERRLRLSSTTSKPPRTLADRGQREVPRASLSAFLGYH